MQFCGLPAAEKNAARGRLPQTAETDDLISDAEFANLDYDKREKRYRLSLTEKQVSEKSEILQKLLEQAYERMR